MRGRPPKPPGLRQRRNRSATRATLPSEEQAAKATVPPLPKRSRGTGSWHPRVRAWWDAIWRSPMAAEYLDADRQRLGLVAELHQRFWLAGERGESLTKLASEIRQQELLFGLTPMDRRRLQWQVDQGEQAAERTQRRKGVKARATGNDPRDVLRLA